MVALLVVGFAALLVGALSFSAMNSARQERTTAALAQAKDALIGKSITYDDYPGSLPCPDTDNDGVSDAGGASECPIYIGRLPWKTLGLPELRDGAGEQLWYTLSRNFRRYVSVLPLNSNTQGTLNITGTETASNVIAIVFSPGSALSGQNRSAAQTASCITTGTTVAYSLCATNYLEGSNKNLSSAATPNTNYQSAFAGNTFNDQLLFITTHDLMPLVEQRVAGVVKQALNDYYIASDTNPSNRYYPWADSIGTTISYASDIGLNRGWLPKNADTSGTNPTLDWDAGSLPAWFIPNEWYTLIYYSVAKDKTVKSSLCTTCVSTKLTVVNNNVTPSNTDNQVQVLFFMPGTPIGTRWYDKLDDYLEDSANNQHDAVPNASPPPPSVSASATPPDDNYIIPTSQNKDRDRIYYFSGTTWKP